MRTGAVTVAAITLLVAACGGKPEDGAAAASDGTAVQGPDTARSEDEVAAVLQSPGAPLAKLTFQIQNRPEAGKPFGVKLSLTAAEAMPALQVAVESSSLVAAPDTATLALAAAGSAVSHELTVTASQEGLAELVVRLKADAIESVYVIPVLVTSAATG